MERSADASIDLCALSGAPGAPPTTTSAIATASVSPAIDPNRLKRVRFAFIWPLGTCGTVPPTSADLCPGAQSQVGAARGTTILALSVPERLLQRLDLLGEVLAARADAIALIGHGSVGVDLHRLDDHSDLDFFVIVDDGAKQRYLDSIDWLEALHRVAYSFANTLDGRKVLFADGLFAEYAVFTLDELARGSFSPGRIVWQRADAPSGLEKPPPRDSPAHQTPEHQLNEA